MATFKKVENGWKAEVCVGGKRKAKTRPTKAEAKSWAVEMEFQLAQQSESISTTHKLDEVFVRYANEVSEIKKGAQWEIVRLKKFQRDPLANVLLMDLKREHIEDWISRSLKTLLPSSVNRELNLISHCLTQARRWRLMDHNPMADLKRPKNPPHRDRRILDNEIAAILFSLKYSPDCQVIEQQQRVALAMLFAIETAMRAGEICSLEACYIDLKARTAHLPDTKNGLKRDVALSRAAVALLERLMPWPETGPLFRLASGVLSTLFKKGVDRAGVVGLTFHDTRHEAITRLASKLDVLDLARMVGHRDIKQLMTYYNKSAADLAVQLG